MWPWLGPRRRAAMGPQFLVNYCHTHQVLTLLSSRHPSLAPLMREQRDYILSSVQKLDAPKAMARWREPGERPVVLAVIGRGHVDYIIENWRISVDRRMLAARRHGWGGELTLQAYDLSLVSVAQRVGILEAVAMYDILCAVAVV